MPRVDRAMAPPPAKANPLAQVGWAVKRAGVVKVAIEFEIHAAPASWECVFWSIGQLWPICTMYPGQIRVCKSDGYGQVFSTYP